MKKTDLAEVNDRVNKLASGGERCQVLNRMVCFSLLQALRYMFAYFDGGDERNREGLENFLRQTEAQLSELSEKAKKTESLKKDLTARLDRMSEEVAAHEKYEHMHDELEALKSLLGEARVSDFAGMLEAVPKVVTGLRRLLKVESLVKRPAKDPVVVNMTPHPILVYAEDGKTLVKEYPPSGTIARLDTPHEVVGKVAGIPLTRKLSSKDITGLPDPKDNTFYIVSGMCKMAVPERNDCVIPDHLVRDENGVVIGCRALRG